MSNLIKCKILPHGNITITDGFFELYWREHCRCLPRYETGDTFYDFANLERVRESSTPTLIEHRFTCNWASDQVRGAYEGSLCATIRFQTIAENKQEISLVVEPSFNEPGTPITWKPVLPEPHLVGIFEQFLKYLPSEPDRMTLSPKVGLGSDKKGREPLTEDGLRERAEVVKKVEEVRTKEGVTYPQACARVAIPYSTFRDWRRRVKSADE